uniref:Calmodulin n=1 Tax=Haptolina brevifila TaxID=156173 RepID=A0A7S2D0N5_9EUKA|mmetsp:Transcript_31504/g.62954  ORF Transcript_31504/g.62954 Transcript_31504/m.62954 type:complete len:304 (+) Transcript_31504:42-953(+)
MNTAPLCCVRMARFPFWSARNAHHGASFRTVPGSADLDTEGLFSLLKGNDLQDGIMSASIGGEGQQKEARRDDGLVAAHVFSILQVAEVQGLRLIQLRNPWGSAFEWNGRWSDESISWDEHPEIKQEVGFEPGPNGLFWMAFDEFASIFDSIQSCSTAAAKAKAEVGNVFWTKRIITRRGKNAISTRITRLRMDWQADSASEDASTSSPQAALEERLRSAFSNFDLNQDNVLSASELRKILTRSGGGHALSDEDVEELIALMDWNGDGALSVEEFIQGWAMLESASGAAEVPAHQVPLLPIQE